MRRGLKMTDASFEIQEMSLDEIDGVGGGKVTASQVLAAGAAIAGVGAAILGAPAIVGVAGTASAVYWGVSGVMALGSAVAAMNGE